MRWALNTRKPLVAEDLRAELEALRDSYLVINLHPQRYLDDPEAAGAPDVALQKRKDDLAELGAHMDAGIAAACALAGAEGAYEPGRKVHATIQGRLYPSPKRGEAGTTLSVVVQVAAEE